MHKSYNTENEIIKIREKLAEALKEAHHYKNTPRRMQMFINDCRLILKNLEE